MKRFMLPVTFMFSLLALVGYAHAQDILFQAFTGEKPIPNAAAEDVDEWNDRNVTKGLNSFKVTDGRLEQTSNDCAASTKTLFPVDGAESWTDYSVVVDIWWLDDDGVSIVFRYTDEDNYYIFTI